MPTFLLSLLDVKLYPSLHQAASEQTQVWFHSTDEPSQTSANRGSCPPAWPYLLLQASAYPSEPQRADPESGTAAEHHSVPGSGLCQLHALNELMLAANPQCSTRGCRDTAWAGEETGPPFNSSPKIDQLSSVIQLEAHSCSEYPPLHIQIPGKLS